MSYVNLDPSDPTFKGRFGKDLPGKKVAWVTTDAWNWSMADLEIAKKLEKVKNLQQVEVKPGRYRVTQLYHTRPEHQQCASTKPHIYAEIEWIHACQQQQH